MIYLELFWSFFQVGLFCIGGGYAALPMIKMHVVDNHAWLSLKEFTDVVTISQMTPGPIGINAATFVGTKMAGLPGAVVATFGCVAPSIVIVLVLAYIYTKYKNIKIIQGILGNLRPAVVGLIAASGLSIVVLTFWQGHAPSANIESIDIFAVLLFSAALFLLQRFKINPIFVILGAGGLGVVTHIIQIV